MVDFSNKYLISADNSGQISKFDFRTGEIIDVKVIYCNFSVFNLF